MYEFTPTPVEQIPVVRPAILPALVIVLSQWFGIDSGRTQASIQVRQGQVDPVPQAAASCTGILGTG